MDTNRTAPDKTKLKQWLVVGPITIVFADALYMILRPYLIREDKIGNGQLLTDVPDTDVVKLPEDKLPAYKGTGLVDLGEEQVDSRLQCLYDEQDYTDGSAEYGTNRYPCNEDCDPYEDEDL